MSVSISEVIESAGYVLNNVEDCRWLLAQKDEFNEICEEAEKLIDEYEEKEYQTLLDEDDEEEDE